MASCSQARSLSSAHAAIIARYLIMSIPSGRSFSKHCAASARRKSCRTSRLCLWRDHFLHEGFKTRIAVQWIEQVIDFDPADVQTIAFIKTLFEPAQRFLLVVQAEIKKRSPIAEPLAVLPYLSELGQHSPRRILAARVCFRCGAQRRHKWIVAQLPGFLVFGNRTGKIAHYLKNNAEIIMRVEESRIDREGLAQLRNRLV